MTSITIAGPKFSGKPGDWPDTKTEIVDAFNSAGAGFVNAMGEQLFLDFGEFAFLPFSLGPPGDCPWRH